MTSLSAGDSLRPGQSLASAGGQSKLVFQEDGNIVVSIEACSVITRTMFRIPGFSAPHVLGVLSTRAITTMANRSSTALRRGWRQLHADQQSAYRN